MARKRKPANRDLPPNLYVRNNGYYCYRDPRTGKEYGLGSVKRIAINEAIAMNMQIFDQRYSLVDRINEVNTLSVTEWAARFKEKLHQRGLRSNTIRDYQSRLTAITHAFPDSTLNTLTTKEIAEFLNSYSVQGKTSSAKLIRSLLIDMFNEAIAEGHLATNPATATKNPRVQIQRERLSLEEFLAIRGVANQQQPWVGLGMDLALLTGQRVGDIQRMKWQDIHDGKWWVEQQKTGMKLAIPLTLSLEIINKNFEGILNNCRQQIKGEEYVFMGSKKINLSPTRLSKGFARSREKSGLKWQGTPPSFHEIRSLSARLHSEARGKDFAQKLLGHKSSAMTDKYRDSRGSEWDKI
ncbi:phage integrase Arm DNA-binding domain-containing protein [Candidatus Fukatsuia symbiotica]|uniref:Integrase n=1 Tax=Candidatus Fukatsuia symbiotica TaxID=1878942 RepID=A0A2U8I3Y0_9GAMM|nr:tyrosine-type recombinase/integrase [Candidatus Fukatsuia symbiotica]AWK13846.1 integrase [Candidatus Fukatsuia symbiotica]MEA9446051.1 phage integrase Arm DNA-binding domain-containing protein [Candidatus Fukatsuia symbiotica]